MGQAVESLMDHFRAGTGYDIAYEDVRDKQVQAMNERLQEQISKIKLVSMRAEDCGVSEISSLEQAIPMLLPHTAYKSYPESYLHNQRWDKLTKWVGSVTASSVDNIDLENIEGIDQWVDRMHAAGHYASCSSGTTGRPAILNLSEADIQFGKKDLVNAICWATEISDDQSWQTVSSAPVAMVPKNTAMGMSLFSAFARTDKAPIAFDVPPITVGSLMDMILIRKKIADGAALPDELAAFEKVGADRETIMANALDTCAEAVIAGRDEKFLFMGMWGGHYALARAVRDRGYSAEHFSPANAMFVSGGLKRAQVPDDYREFVYETFNIRPESTFMSYGMQEIQTNMPRCHKGRYHIPAWLVCLPLNENGDELMPSSNGRVEGRAAFFDLALESRWGGVISGDKIEIDYNHCACGAKSPSISDTITRYADLKGDDKIGCAGTVDSYVRGIS